MKHLILITSFISAATAAMAQTECSYGNPIFQKEHAGTPKDVYTLGANPEFPFLRNLSTPQQVATAMKSARRAELNNILREAGFANGANDITASSISAYYIPEGTIGNMGDGNYNTAYIKLMADGNGNSQGVKSWKVTSPSGCYVYFLNKCGNAFFPTATKTTACLTVPVTITADTKTVTLGGSPVVTNTTNTYIYYHRKKAKKMPLARQFDDLNDRQASTPLLLNASKKAESAPQTYKVTVSSPDNSVNVCADKPLEVAATINVEKTSEYAGYYPSKGQRQYKEVSKRVYRKTAKKMRKVNRKETKVALMTHTAITTDVAAR